MLKILNKEFKNIILLIVSSFFSNISNYIFDIGILIYLYDSTKSPSVISGYFISQLLPVFLLLFLGGTIDKFNKKYLVIITIILRLFFLILILINKNMFIIYLTSFILNLLYEFEGNIINSIIPELISKNKIIKISSLKNVVDSCSMILGPILASLIIISTNVNINIIINIFCYCIIFISFIFFDICNSKVIIQRSLCKITSFTPSIILKNKKIIPIIIYWSLFMFFIGLTAPLEIIKITDVLQQPSSFYGVGNSIEGIGMLLASFFLLNFCHKFKSFEIIRLGLLISTFGYIIIGFSNHIYIYFIGAFFVGVTASFCPIGFKSSIQLNTNTEILGRTFTISRFIILVFRLIGTLSLSFILKKVPIEIIYYFTSFILFLMTLSFSLLKIKKIINSDFL